MALNILLLISHSVLAIETKGNCGTGIVETGITNDERKQILEEHNRLRQLVAKGLVQGQPKAKRMNNLVWDRNLENAAKEISQTCSYGHVQVKDQRFYVGQNIAIKMSSSNNANFLWNWVMDAWYNEYKIYIYPKAPDEKTGHYTQIVWSDTSYIGCSATKWTTNEMYQYKKFYVCNYGPGGNIINRAPYEKA